MQNKLSKIAIILSSIAIILSISDKIELKASNTLQSQGKLIYEQEGEEDLVIDTNDFQVLQDNIDTLNANLSSKISANGTKLNDALIITTQSKQAAKCNVDAHVSVTFTDDTPDGYKLISVMYRSNSTAYVHWHRTNTVVSLVHLLGADDINAPTITRTAVYARSDLF